MDPESEPRSTPPEDKTSVATASTQEAVLPEGWSTAVSPIDGRKYYWNQSTGATSWTHPSTGGAAAAPAPVSSPIITALSLGEFSGIMAARSAAIDKDVETGKTDYAAMDDKGDFHEYDPNQAVINSHRCYSIIAFLLFFPLGMIALCKSCSVVSKYHQGRYKTAHDHSQQTLLFSRISCIIGVCLWSYIGYCLWAGPGPGVIEIPAEWWPEWK